MSNDHGTGARGKDRGATDHGRRRSLKQIGGLAASVAPAMVVLLHGDGAGAHHDSRPSAGRGNGNGSGGHCGGPRWNYGGVGNGHSGC